MRQKYALDRRGRGTDEIYDGMMKVRPDSEGDLGVYLRCFQAATIDTFLNKKIEFSRAKTVRSLDIN